MRKADLDYQMGPFKKTALHLAVEYNAELTIKFLLKHGAKIETKDIFGFDIYEQALEEELARMVKKQTGSRPLVFVHFTQ